MPHSLPSCSSNFVKEGQKTSREFTKANGLVDMLNWVTLGFASNNISTLLTPPTNDPVRSWWITGRAAQSDSL